MYLDARLIMFTVVMKETTVAENPVINSHDKIYTSELYLHLYPC